MPPGEELYLVKFANRELGPECFDHRGHLYMAWLHLRRYDLDEAIERVCDGIHELAGKFGAPEKYHRTLTEALMRIIDLRMKQREQDDFESFLRRNADLVRDAPDVLSRHYSGQRLASTDARTAWVAPDRRPIE